MDVRDLFDDVVTKAKEFGLIAKNEGRNVVDPKGNAVIRNNLLDQSFSDGSAYFGFINSEEETAGPYSDLSFVIFPDASDAKTCVVSLVVGSSGFRSDYQLASLPGLKRSFLRLKSDDNLSFFKTSFEDIESTATDLVTKVRADYPSLRNVIESYKTVILASRIVSLESNALDIILDSIPMPVLTKEKKEIKDLLDRRRYVVLQGAPGTGKTYTALKIAEMEEGGEKIFRKTFFEQFHAETTYSDFVYGLEPKTSSGGSLFQVKEGILYQAVRYAIEHKGENVLLIIDEINRANLSNVLGPVFYLFEFQAGPRSTIMNLGDLELSKLPDNLYVIATMNTADRSLAVVDFALRRRFAWYTLRPHKVTPEKGKTFMDKIYNRFSEIFYEYATDDELNLQPGQSYFIVDSDNKEKNMKERLIYELMPLIKEYLAEGYLLKARDSFCDLFLKETGKMLYE